MTKKIKYNYGKLNFQLREQGLTQSEFAEKVGISTTSMNMRLQNRRAFSQDEISVACSVLGIKAHEISSFFFTPLD